MRFNQTHIKATAISTLLAVFTTCSFITPSRDSWQNDYFPLNIGDSLIYEETGENGISYGTMVSTIERSLEIFGKTNYILASYFLSDDTIQVVETVLTSGNDIYAKWTDSVLFKVAQHTYLGGEKWTNILAPSVVDTYNCSYWGYISLPVGNFDSCFAVITSRTSLIDTVVYAPSIGMVYRVIKSVSGFRKSILTNIRKH
jgi:hypothetical protein